MKPFNNIFVYFDKKPRVMNSTGYNPVYSNYTRTAKEDQFTETSAVKNNFADLVKEGPVIISEEFVPLEEIHPPI